MIGVFGIAGPALGAEGAPRSWTGWILLILGAAAGSLVATDLLDRVLAWVSRRWAWSWVWALLRPAVLSALVIALTVTLGIGVAAGISTTRALLRVCPPPVEVPVVTGEDELATARFLADEFERSTAVGRRKCPAANLSVYAASAPAVRAALLGRWSVPPGSEPVVAGPLRDVGPRPMLWLPSSTVEVDRLLAEAPKGDGVPFVGAAVYARTPLVLAVPQRIARPAERGGDWRGAITKLRIAGVSVLRTDPSVSAAGEFAVAAVHAASGMRSQAQTDAARRLEQEFAASLQRSGYPLGGSAAVLRTYRERSCASPQSVAFLLPRQLVERPELVGSPISDGDECAGTGRRLAPIFSQDGLTLDRPVVVLDWETEARDPAALMAGRFRAWLLSESGRRVVARTGLTPGGGPPRAGPATADDDMPRPFDAALLRRIDDALRFQASVRRQVRVLIALDTSLSLGARFGAASAVVDNVVSRLGEKDDVGLVSFGRAGALARVPLAPAGSASDPDAWRRRVHAAVDRERPSGETALWPALGVAVDSASPEVAGGKEAPVSAVVVITDGRIEPGGSERRRVVDQARRSGVRVFVVAVGAECGWLDGVGTQLRGLCREVGGAGTGLDDVAAAMWGAAGAG